MLTQSTSAHLRHGRTTIERKRLPRRPLRWNPAVHSETPQQHYLVRPRHLAGGGDLAHVTAYLTGASWKNITPRSGSPLAFRSPDRSVRVGYAAGGTPPMWIISGNPPGRPAWHATVGAAVPVEILAGLAEALTLPRPGHAPDVLGRLIAHGWDLAESKHPSVEHPDGTALVQYRRDGDTALWWVSAHTPSDPPLPLWTAAFSVHTPLHAVEAFAAALAQPQPALRPPGRIPHSTAAHATITSYPVLASQLAAGIRDRAAAGRAAAWARSLHAIAARRHRPSPAKPRPRVEAATTPPRPSAPPRPAQPPRTR